MLDPRIHAYRKDIADIALAGRLIAPHYARPAVRRIESGATLFVEASEAAESVAQLDAGEDFAVLDITGQWAWGYRRKDHKVGYIPAAALGEPPAA